MANGIVGPGVSGTPEHARPAPRFPLPGFGELPLDLLGLHAFMSQVLFAWALGQLWLLVQPLLLHFGAAN